VVSSIESTEIGGFPIVALFFSGLRIWGSEGSSRKILRPIASCLKPIDCLTDFMKKDAGPDGGGQSVQRAKFEVTNKSSELFLRALQADIMAYA
jgi:hypothetical protein